MATDLLTIRGLTKAYAVPVLSDVDLDLQAGEVHALMGPNGAGKSTLERILAGLTTADGGTMTLAGATHAPASRLAAEHAGVQIVLQELNLISTLTVAENLFLARLPRRRGLIDRAALYARTAEALATVGLGDLDPRTSVASLGAGLRQLVAIARALVRDCRVLILDEPTAALSPPDVDRLLAHVRRLRDDGVGVLYISHRLDEIRRVADRVTVLRDGRVVDRRPADRLDHDTLLDVMTGGTASTGVPLRAPQAVSTAVALRVEGLQRGPAVRDVSFEVRRGEILGLSGLVGAGRSETLRLIFGADVPDRGLVTLGDGPPLRLRGPRDAVRAGIGMVPEDRQGQALLLPQSVRTNITLAALPSLSRGRTWIDAATESATASALAARLGVRGQGLEQPVGTLSGGNQQKTVIARWLLRDCPVLLVDEPTRGIDIGAKQVIHQLLRDLAARGSALVVVSSDLEELTALCDRIVVLSAGRVTGAFSHDDGWDHHGLMQAAFAGQGAR